MEEDLTGAVKKMEIIEKKLCPKDFTNNSCTKDSDCKVQCQKFLYKDGECNTASKYPVGKVCVCMGDC